MTVARSGRSESGLRVRVSPKLAAMVVALAAAILLAMWILVPPAGALAEPEFRWLTGTDRYQTAIKISQDGFAPGVDAVVIASGEEYQGALCAATLAGVYGGPVLLTGSTIFGDTTRDEVVRLDPSKVFLVELAPLVVDEIKADFPDLAAAGAMVEIKGVDHYDTARLVAEEVRARLGTVSGVVLVPGDKFPDAVAVSPLAAVKGWPILLTPALGPLPDATAQAFATLGATFVLEAGSYVDPAIPGQTVVRFAGVDRYDTAARVAEYARSQGLSFAHLGAVTGDNFPDALAAGPYVARDGGMTVLVQQTGVPSFTSALLTAHAEEIGSVDFIGLSTTAGNLVRFILGVTGLPVGFDFPTLSLGSSGPEVAWLEQRLVDLSYRPGPVDGVFDKRTDKAVIAFQKWEGLSRTGTVAKSTWTSLLSAARPTPQGSYTGVSLEVDKSKQVLLFCIDGVVERTLPCSTGNPAVDGGIYTPSGVHTVTRSNTWETVRYKPFYIRPTWSVLAIHGYKSVPAYAASHGCVRITLWDMDELHLNDEQLVPVGTTVYIY